MQSSQNEKRITVRLKSPNPLFEAWLTTWRDQAAAKESKMQYSFNMALKSLKKFPLPLESGRECKILKGFGDKLCQMLDEKLAEYNRTNNKGNFMEVSSTSNEVPLSKILSTEPPRSRKVPTELPQSKKAQYVPQYGSGGYAILLTLYKQSLEPGYAGFMKKSEIILHGKHLVNSSFTKPEAGSRYTAWSSMRTLLSKNLVSKASHPPKFSLTDEGRILAKKLHEASIGEASVSSGCAVTDMTNRDFDVADLQEEEELFDYPLNLPLQNDNGQEQVGQIVQDKAIRKPLERFASSPAISSSQKQKGISKTIRKCPSTNTAPPNNECSLKKICSSNSFASTKSSVSAFEHFIIPSGGFDIILYVDNNETSGSFNVENDELLIELKKSGVKFEVKNLKVGDFTWVCREREFGKELVLPYVIERKRMDDLAHSIKDRRYYEQKFRLKKSGIENLTYLVESYGKNQHLGLPLQTLLQAATNTAIQDNFFIKFTENIRETVEYLVNYSKTLIGVFKSKTLASCPKDDLQLLDLNEDIVALMTFKEFNESSAKNKKINVTDLFVKMLIQIKGMSVERALAVTGKYPTPLLLKKAYDMNLGNNNEQLLSNVKFGPHGKTLGAVLSKTIYQAFCKMQY